MKPVLEKAPGTPPAPAACATARRREPLVSAPALDEQARRGQRVYAMHCDSCHPGGEGGLAR